MKIKQSKIWKNVEQSAEMAIYVVTAEILLSFVSAEG